MEAFTASSTSSVCTHQMVSSDAIASGATLVADANPGVGSTPMTNDDWADGSFPTKGPLRKCVATGEVRPKSQLLRFVLSPDGDLTFDVRRKLPGRGLWLTPSVDAFELAQKRGGFSRAAKQKVAVPADLMEKVSKILEVRLLQRLGLARKGGQLVLGTAKVEAACQSREVCSLWLSDDTSAETLAQWQNKGLPIVQAFDRMALADVLGRAQVVVMGLKHGARENKIETAYLDVGTKALPTLGPGWQDLGIELQHYLNLAPERQTAY